MFGRIAFCITGEFMALVGIRYFACKKCGTSVVEKSSNQRESLCKFCQGSRIKKHSVRSGDRSGRLVALFADPGNDYNWICKCDCGRLARTNVYHIVNKRTLSCDCLRVERAKNSRWTGYGEISGKHWKGIIASAKTRNIEFNLSIEEVWKKYIAQDKRCALTGTDLIMHVPNNKRGSTASLDRIDSSLGYTPENVWWLHKTVNDMKWHLSVDRLIELCGLVLTPITGDPCQEIIEKRHHCNWLGYGNISGHNWSVISRGAKARGIGFYISIEFAWSLFIQQRGRCTITGLPLKLHHNRTASVDRIDRLLPYTEDNIRWVHKDINRCLRKERNDTTMYKWCERVVKYAD